jgi:hypothetical protein
MNIPSWSGSLKHGETVTHKGKTYRHEDYTIPGNIVKHTGKLRVYSRLMLVL